MNFKKRGAPDRANLLKDFFNRLCAKGLNFGSFFSSLAAGFMLATFNAVSSSKREMLFTNISFVNNVNIFNFILIFLTVSAMIVILTLIWGNAIISSISLFCATVLLSYSLINIVAVESYVASGYVDIVFLVGIAAAIIIIMKYLSSNDKLMIGQLSKTRTFSSWRAMYALTTVFVITFIVVVSIVSSYRYLTFTTSTFDFGIFSQMFKSMSKTGLPMTTVERGKELSHFAVHFSPSWYLLLPGYLIFQSPLFLYFANALVIGIGAFPVFRICKKIGTSPLSATAFSVMYLLFPSMAAGTLWDIHENSFLPVLILYMVYFFLDKKIVPMWIFTFLTLGTKEDAAIYVAAFALYVIFTTKRKKLGLLLILAAATYFFFATTMITYLGGEVMTSRFRAYFPEGYNGFTGLIKTSFVNIGYIIRNVFSLNYTAPAAAKSEAVLFGQGKLQFILWMLLPVLFAPFLAKKNSLLFLLIPMVVINLMPNWSYQYNVYYQYTYGPAALIILATILTFSQMRKEKRIMFVSTSLVLCFLFSTALFLPKGSEYIKNYNRNKPIFQSNQQTIDLFLQEYYVEGDSVAANCYFVPHLSEVTLLFTVPEQTAKLHTTDWYIRHIKFSSKGYNPEIFKSYECINPNDTSYVRVYKKTD